MAISKPAVWCRLVHILQWLLLLCVIVGLGWLLVLAGSKYVSVAVPVAPEIRQVPVPTVLVVAGLVVGIVLGLVCRVVVARSGRRKAERADRALRSAIAEVAQNKVIGPVSRELELYASCRSGLLAAGAAVTARQVDAP